MPRRPVLVVAVAAALSVPAVALADNIGPHSSLYTQHPQHSPSKTHPPSNNVVVIVNRARGDASVVVENFCLGKHAEIVSGPPGSPAFQWPAGISFQRRLHRGTLSFKGKARESSMGSGTTGKNIRVTFSARVIRKTVTGYATFPGTKCGRLHFIARLRERTK